MPALDPKETIDILTYANPVHPTDFPDPFALRYKGTYYAVCTGFWKDGKVFGIMRSPDLIHWEELGGALDPLAPHDPTIPYTCYWAPEIYRFGEKFYLYYSVGNETWMHIRVGVADHPAGPYHDSGKKLTNEQFAIDPHVFRDDDGQHYLFYATDFLDHPHIGTGTVQDRLLDPFTLAGKPQPVTRARYDWQVYDPERKEKGGVRWHTVEGPFVIKRKGVYYETFSGGNWQNKTYGVSYATTSDISLNSEWEQHCDGEKTLPILRTISADYGSTPVIGPGHNSIVQGPTSLEQWCIYHQWNRELNGRVLSIDRMDFVGDEMIILGPSTELQEIPARPHLSLSDPSNQLIELNSACFVVNAEIDLSLSAYAEIAFLTGSEQLRLRVENNRLSLVQVDQLIAALELPYTLRRFTAVKGFNLHITSNHRSIEIKIEGHLVFTAELERKVKHIEILNERQTIAYLELSYGWEDLFKENNLSAIGWIESSADPTAKIEDGAIQLSGNAGDHVLVKATGSEDYELIVNVRLVSCDLNNHQRAIAYGVYPCLPDNIEHIDEYPLIAIKRVAGGETSHWTLQAISADLRTMFTLPESFDPARYNQFRFRKRGSQLHLLLGKEEIGTLDVPTLTSNVGLCASGCNAAIEMVRLISYS